MEREQARKMRRLLDLWGHTLYIVRRKEEEIAELRVMVEAAYECLQASQIRDMPRGDGLPKSGVERALEDVEWCAEQYEMSAKIIRARIEKALELKQTIDEAIDEFDTETQKVLQMRYADDRKWVFIALKMESSESRVRAIEAQAVEALLTKVDFE